ncbi:hypothetical protein H0B56_19865 [Haloechinothrix sp. YIM 98757]|uniref:Uncharacterized protein n=1 Tax=Haloechinothrix aidingensis TaxID=2752311 RepID=A0A838AFA8_9PSEU|nr:hypothetical protein [Haloechinothrix aidingensis]MBA0127808.1 hypothetical protein [Haloechinothrix aidingensis]
MNLLLDRHLEEVQRKTKKRYEELVALHVRPLIGEEKAGRVDGEIVDSLYAELRRCRIHSRMANGLVDHRTSRPHACRPLAGNTMRQCWANAPADARGRLAHPGTS